MSGTLAIAYLLAGVLFIRSLGGLSKQETARVGSLYGIIGMALAIAVTALRWTDGDLNIFVTRGFGTVLLVGAVGIGCVVGAVLAKRVEMTGMPELVAILHSFVGLAAVLVGVSSYLAPHGAETTMVSLSVTKSDSASVLVHLVEIWVGVAVGAVTFTGSIIAWAKLKGSLSGKPLLLPGRHIINLAIAAAIAGLAVPFVQTQSPNEGVLLLGMMAGLAGLLGIHLVLAIGGADMPVVVSLLNSYSGWAAAAAGFMLANDLLIMTGALVGASGAILSIIMCRAMNRSILNVVFGGFGTAEGKVAAGPQAAGEVIKIEAADLVAQLQEARNVIVVPGYGMAVARAQGAVYEFSKALKARGVNVRFAIHPVAGRLPGHMNVLLAEAGVPYDIVLEMEHINHDFAKTDVVLVIGANDIVNPGALDDASSPIYGMPVLEVWHARTVVVLKRGMAAGYAGVENPLFIRPNTRMFFGDAKSSMDALVAGLK
ncbi:MAG: NAD(P)(+) transhydrogenase (Re/Si-specific) subunit beta [Myxococcaceae bacterium]|nr:NAD(P)(+) transhydrogenase (Re/Si-specific) subunit beta [Myxococcaceae bacterium]